MATTPQYPLTPSNVNSSQHECRLLTLPAEIRNQIWAYCVDVGEDQELVIVGSEVRLYNLDIKRAWIHPPTTFSPAFLLTNKQIRREARAMFWSSNQFSLVLNEGSFLGRRQGFPANAFKDDGTMAAVPSTWNLRLRGHMHQMKAVRIYIVLGFEHMNGKALASPADVAKKREIASIVQHALEELCGTLLLSKNLTSLEVKFADIGRLDLKTGREVCVLAPLGHLREIQNVKVEGVPGDWTKYLEDAMKMRKAIKGEAAIVRDN